MDKFRPRDYQLPLLKAMLVDNYPRAFCSWARRAGKDLTAYNILIRKALETVGVYFIVLPTFASGRRIIWDAITSDGIKLLDFLPKELIAKTNDQRMMVYLKNGSTISIVGSNDYNNVLVGTNVRGMVFSEYALQDPNCYKYSIPILNANRGSWAIFLSTPRGKNHFFDLYNVALSNPDVWFTSVLTVDDTKHIPVDQIEADIARGEISREMARQEYWVDFALGIEGSWWGSYIDTMRLKGRIGAISWDPAHPVAVSLDLGIRDTTAIIFAQYINNQLYILESFEDRNKGLDYYIKVIKSKDYTYSKFLAPCDIHVREYTSGRSRYDIAKQLGINFTTVGLRSANGHYTPFPVIDSIEVARTVLPRTYIDLNSNKRLIRCLESYAKEWDAKNNCFKSKVVHNDYSHMADSFRYLCMGLKQLGNGQSKEEIMELNRKAHGIEPNLPAALTTQRYYG